MEWLSPREPDQPDALAILAERQRLINEAGRALTQKQRLVLLYRYVGGMSYAEIGKELRVTKVAVFGIHERAIAVMERELGEMGISKFQDL